ncbi:Fic family protein [Verminephrobacter aporrectodeae]|uniref:Fic family protein n=1 Tax=Verminephrobacter aporrectodeae TaxID=1110389 RepID=UPI000237650B|nr:Fic family protein [Verminephrobacter aporrectodeae]
MIATHAIQISPEILQLIASIDDFQGAWRALGTLESIGSSPRIEGSKLSDREVERLLSNLRIKSFPTRDEQEVAGYAKGMERVFSSWQDITLTENHVKQLHRDLLTCSEKDAWHRGNYKTSTNSVVAFDEEGKQLGVVFETATPFDTPRLMTELVTWFNEERDAARSERRLKTA